MTNKSPSVIAGHIKSPIKQRTDENRKKQGDISRRTKELNHEQMTKRNEMLARDNKRLDYLAYFANDLELAHFGDDMLKALFKHRLHQNRLKLCEQ